ncbi:MAG: cation transporter [Nitrospinae bacterium]|nr:cation transporter [Nitrospinota bacterium]
MEDKSTLALGYKATAISTASDILLAIAKFIAGTLGNSSALIADAVHSVTDLATDAVSFISLKVSHLEPDEDHPYGHGKAETIGTAIIGIIVMAVGAGIMWEEQKHFMGTGQITPPTSIAVWGAAVSLVIKEFLFVYTLRVGNKARSESVIANAWHHRSDSLSSLAALVGIGGAMMGYRAMDPLAAVIVGLMILHMGGQIGWGAMQNLMDPGLGPEELMEIETIVAQTPGVVHYHGVRSRKAGRDTFVDIHIQVEPRISISEAHNIAETARHELKRKARHLTDAMIHIDAEDDTEGRLYRDRRAQVEKIVNDALADFPTLRLTDGVVIHYFLQRLVAEVTLDSGDNLNVSDAKAIAACIKERLFADGIITEVVVRHDLGRWKKEDRQ